MATITVTKENYEELVLKAPGKVLLDFWAPWCGPCKMIAPIVEEIAEEHEELTVGKVNVDEQIELSFSFGVKSIPTLVVLEGGKTVTKAIGYRPKAELLSLLDL